jgi:multiple sugar transport system permease protein
VKRKNKDGKTKYWLFVPTMFVLILMTIVPFIFSLVTSLTNYKATEPDHWKFVGLDNFVRAVLDKDIQSSFINTLVYVGGSVAIEFVLGMLIALLLNRKMRGITMIRTFLLLPMMATPVAVGLLWRWMLNPDFGIINYYLQAWFGITGPNWLVESSLAMPVVIGVDVWQWTPFMVLSLLAGLQALGEEPIEAARVDGATPLQMFWHVTLPQLRSIIMVVLLIRVIDAFKSFDVVWTLTNGGPGISTELLSLRVYRIAFKFWETGYASAVSWLFLIVVILITSQFIRFLYRDMPK